MEPMPDLWLVRHGQTEWSETGRHTGTSDIPLTDAGRRQAAALCRVLDRQRFSLVLTSPLGRARDTAKLAGFAAAEVDDDLHEWRYGEYEGLTSDQIHEHAPGWTIWNRTPPGGETAAEVEARARRVLRRLEGADGRALAFAHGHFLRVLTAVSLGLHAADGARFRLDPATVNVVGHEHDYRSLILWNEAPPAL
jgi:probable phosphoglycerate mutase